MRSRVVIAGGSGFIGRHLSRRFIAAGYEVVVLSRSAAAAHGARGVQWDGKTVGPWAQELNGAQGVINLAGRNINCRHTAGNMRAILESRVHSVHALAGALSQIQTPPPVFVQTSAVGIYGDAGDRICDESAPHGTDELAQICQQWENALTAVTAAARKVVLRLGVVLGPDGGFFPMISRLTRLFLGGHAGSGNQFVSWIHINDLTHMFLAAVENTEVTGTYNACAPHPVMNRDFMRELRGVLNRPWSPPVPALAVRIGSWLMGSEAKLALVSQRALPRHFLTQDFPFEFPMLKPALADLLSPEANRRTSG